MKPSFRRLLTGLALGAVLVSGLPSLVEAAPVQDRAASLRSAPAAWSPLSAVGEAWSAIWGWVVQAAGGERRPGDGSASSGGTPVPPPEGDKGSGIDPDGKP